MMRYLGKKVNRKLYHGLISETIILGAIREVNEDAAWRNI